MKEVLFESEVFAQNASGGVLPFQIIIEKTIDDGVEKVEVLRKEFTPKVIGLKEGDTPVTGVEESLQVICKSSWHFMP